MKLPSDRAGAKLVAQNALAFALQEGVVWLSYVWFHPVSFGAFSGICMFPHTSHLIILMSSSQVRKLVMPPKHSSKQKAALGTPKFPLLIAR